MATPTAMRAVKRQSSTTIRDIRQEAEEEAMSAKAGAPFPLLLWNTSNSAMVV